MNRDRLRRIEQKAGSKMIQQQRTPTTIILGPSRNVLIWNTGEAEDISEAQAETLRSEGRISMTIRTVSDTGADLARRVCSGELPGPREGTNG